MQGKNSGKIAKLATIGLRQKTWYFLVLKKVDFLSPKLFFYFKSVLGRKLFS